MAGLIPREQAWELLTAYNRDAFHLHHALVLEGVMRYFANELGYGAEADFWSRAGLLHDLDFEQYPQEHCVREQQIMRDAGIDERLIRAVACHGWPAHCEWMPEHEMEKVLYAVDELTGLIGAVALMRPSKSVQDMELKSVKKKFKDKKFAAGCSRDVIAKGAELAMKTVNRNFQMNIERYVVVNIHGLADIIEALGGVDMELTKGEAQAINY